MDHSIFARPKVNARQIVTPDRSLILPGRSRCRTPHRLSPLDYPILIPRPNCPAIFAGGGGGGGGGPALYDNSTEAFNAVSGNSLVSPSYVLGGTNRVVYAGVLVSSATPVNPATVKWNTTEDLTQISSTLDFAPANGKMSIWRLINPTATTATMNAAWAGNHDERLMLIISIKDANQTTPEGAIATNTGIDQAITATAVTVSGDLVIDMSGFIDPGGSNRTIIAGGTQTSRQEIEGADITFEGMGCSTQTASGVSQIMSWAISGALASGAWGTFAWAAKGL